MVTISNIVEGEFNSSDEHIKLFDYSGGKIGQICLSSPVIHRKAIRAAQQVKETLAQIPAQDLIKLVKLTARYYLSEKDYKTIALLSGSPLKYIREVFESLRKWSLNIEDFLNVAFREGEFYDLAPTYYKDQVIGYRKWMPREVITAIFPSNSTQVVPFVIPQLLLSRNPIIIKPSLRGACAYATMKYIEAFHKAAYELGYADLKSMLQMINLSDKNQLQDIVVTGGQLLAFGSNKSIKQILEQLKSTSLSKVVQLGTGFSFSVVTDQANLEHASKEIITSAIEDKGNQCTSIGVVYVYEEAYKKFLKALEKNRKLSKVGDPLNEKTTLGTHDEKTTKELIKRFNDISGSKIKHEHPLDLKIIELDSHSHVEEIPGPILVIKKITSIEDFIFHAKKDIERNEMSKNLAISVFAKDETVLSKLVGKIPTHMLKFNKSTSNINFMLEHQGMYIVKELMDVVHIDLNKPHTIPRNI